MNDFLSGRFTPQDRIYVSIIVVVTLVLVGLFWFVLHASLEEDIKEITQENEAEVAKLEKARKISEDLDTLRRDTDTIEELVKEFEDRLPTKREIATLVREFERMAAEENLEVELASLPRTLDERKETIPYRVVAYGSFHQIASFINRLERFKRYLKITNLNIEPQIKGIATARFTLNTFRFQEQIGEP